MNNNLPVIKGIFVKSHVKAVENALGQSGLHRLEAAYGSPLVFGNSEEVLVRDEVKLIECALRLLKPDLNSEEIEYEAGRLHFHNFRTTPLGRLILPFFKTNFKQVMLQTKHLAGHIFRGVKFYSSEVAEKEIIIGMKNTDYPIDHFRGLFQAWMDYSGIDGHVSQVDVGPNEFQYILKWK